MEPGEIVQAIFSIVISVFVLGVIWIALQGGDVSNISRLATEFAVPFVYGLVAIFFVLWIFKTVSELA